MLESTDVDPTGGPVLRRLMAVFLFLISFGILSGALVGLVNELLDINLELSVGASDIAIPRGYESVIALVVIALLFYAAGYFIQSDSVAAFIRTNKLFSAAITLAIPGAGGVGVYMAYIHLNGGAAFMAAERDDVPEMRRLLQEGAVDPGDLNDLLHRTVRHKSTGVAALLLARKPGPDLKHRYGESQYTALSAAVLWSSPEMVSVLLKAGAPVNVRNKHGHTALMQLILYRSQNESEALEILRALLRAGANPNLADRQGETPLAAARRRKLKRLADALTR